MLSASETAHLLKQASVQNTQTLFDDPKPPMIWYADMPLRLGGVARKIPVSEFMQIYCAKGGEPFAYTESVWFNSRVKQNYVFDQKNSPSLARLLPAEIKALLSKPLMDSLVICFINSEVGFGVFARQEIAPYSLVAIYAGDLVQGQVDSLPSNYALTSCKGSNTSAPFLIEALHRGGIARFFQHLPYLMANYKIDPKVPAKQREFICRLHSWEDDDIKKNAFTINFPLFDFNDAIMQFEQENIDSCTGSLNPDLPSDGLPAQEKEGLALFQKVISQYAWHLPCVSYLKPENLACKNIALKYFLYQGVAIPFFHSVKKIEVGEQIGFDYGYGYWGSERAMPKLFVQSGRMLKREEYQHHCMPMTSYPQPSDVIFIDKADYQKYSKKQLPIQFQPFAKPSSLFATRDALVEHNVLPLRYAAIAEGNQFLLELKKLWPESFGITLKLYYHDPEAENIHDQYAVDVVCRADTLDRYTQLRVLINSHPIADACQLLDTTLEIVISSVNMDTKLMHQFIEHLRSGDIRKYFNESPKIPTAEYEALKQLDRKTYMLIGDKYALVSNR